MNGKLFGVMILLLVILAGCASAGPGGTTPSSTAFTLQEFQIVPSKTEVKAGTVTFTAANKGSMQHNFVIFDAKDKEVKPVSGPKDSLVDVGKTEKITFSLKPGTYQIHCTFPGHFEAGMSAVLVVK